MKIGGVMPGGHAGLIPRVTKVRVASRAWWRQAAAMLG
jgi:hypothetical protein